jgi:hypothetical protein
VKWVSFYCFLVCVCFGFQIMGSAQILWLGYWYKLICKI